MRAYVLDVTDSGVHHGVMDVEPGDDDVTIAVVASALNYKDHLVALESSRVRRATHLVLGVEAAGVVTKSSDPTIRVGDNVIAYGGLIGVGRDGGFAESLSVPSRYVTVLDPRLSPRHAVTYGLAGYSALASILSLERVGLTPGDGEVLVTGATGGVGSLAVALLARRGYDVVASTGSAQHREWLVSLGARRIVGRDEIADRPDRVLASEQWAGAIDCVGGDTLHQILRSLRYGAAVAASGLVAGAELHGDVYPFITRGVSLLGIDAVETPPAVRDSVWKVLADSRVDDDHLVEKTLALGDVAAGLKAIGRGATRGRWLVDPTL